MKREESLWADGLNDLAIEEGENLGVPKSPATFRLSLIGDENAILIRQNVDEAACEIRDAIDPIIQRAREVKVVSDSRFDR